MLTQVDVYGAVNSATALPLSGAGVYGDPVQIKKIDGLGPVKADIQTATYGAINREYLTGKFYGKRNIVLTLGLNPDWATQTVEELRQLLYAYFTPTQQVELRFQSTHLPEVNIFGYVESMDPNIFSADPEIDVSIICPSPNFVATASTVVTGDTVLQTTDVTTPINYVGNVPVGYNLKINRKSGFTNSLTGQTITIINKSPTITTFQSVAYVDASYNYQLNTEQGDKFVRKVGIASGAITNLMYSVALDANWPMISPGENDFLVQAPVANFTWTMTYFAEFGGI